MDKSEALILANSDQYHPLETLGEMMADWLKDSGGYSVTLSKDRSVITEKLNQYDLLILAATTNKLSPAEENAIASFVEGGKKLMAIHSATVLDPDNVKFIEMIGGRFIHHSPYHEFTVKVIKPEHPIVNGVTDFEITDELYVLDREPAGVNTLLTAFWEEKAQPMLYVKTYGDGKILYNALGHDLKAYENPSFKKLIVQGAEWLLR